MRVGKVVGKVSLLKAHRTLIGKTLVLTQPLGLKELAGAQEPKTAENVVLDERGVTPGDLIGMAEGAEATFPFQPVKTPVDAYAACLLDEVQLDRESIADWVT